MRRGAGNVLPIGPAVSAQSTSESYRLLITLGGDSSISLCLQAQPIPRGSVQHEAVDPTVVRSGDMLLPPEEQVGLCKRKAARLGTGRAAWDCRTNGICSESIASRTPPYPPTAESEARQTEVIASEDLRRTTLRERVFRRLDRPGSRNVSCLFVSGLHRQQELRVW